MELVELLVEEFEIVDNRIDFQKRWYLDLRCS